MWDISQPAKPEQSIALDGKAPYSFALFHDNRRLLVGHADGSIEVLDIVNSTSSKPILAHRMPVDAIAISPDDKQVLTSAGVGQVYLWNADAFKNADPKTR